jgi:hypothetical protein
MWHRVIGPKIFISYLYIPCGKPQVVNFFKILNKLPFGNSQMQNKLLNLA